MSQEATIRLARAMDSDSILAIYAPVVRDTAISFEASPPTPAEMRQRVESTTAQLPWLVCERAGGVLGYAYAGAHRTRAAYQWSVETSAYVHADARRCGVARALYTSLFEILALQGYCNAFAIVTLPNPPSVALHESLGFESVGIHRSAGYKLGAWHDVGWWQRRLGEHTPDPSPPRALATVQALPAWTGALSAGVSLLR